MPGIPDRKKKLALIQALLDHGADPLTRSEQAWTPLMGAGGAMGNGLPHVDERCGGGELGCGGGHEGTRGFYPQQNRADRSQNSPHIGQG